MLQIGKGGPVLTDDLIEAQRSYEDATLAVGAQRYKDRQDRKGTFEGFDRRDNVAKMLRGAIPIASKGIASWLETTKAAKGRKPSGFKALSELDPDLLAYVALSRIFRELPNGGGVTPIVISIGRAVEIEIEAEALRTEDKDRYKRLQKMAEGEASERVLARRHEAAAEEFSLGWSSSTKAGVGQSLLGIILIELADIFCRGTATIRGHSHPVVELTDAAATMLVEMEEAAAWLRPPLQPMLTAPRAWTGLYTGCYHDYRLAKAVPLVRTYNGEHKKLLKEAIADGSMQEVLDAVNAIQDTRWAIDERVLDVVRWTRQEGRKPSASFPTSQLPELPKKATEEEWAGMDRAKRIALSRNRKAIRDIRAAAGIDAGAFSGDMLTAEFLAEHEAFYLPHSLDFRGRTYAVPYFNHQRSDHMKALFRFADAVPLGPEGGDWLMIHLANCGDFKLPNGKKVSKEPFDVRIAWVRENEGAILMAARDPQGEYEFWSQADSPFCFLQACFEYDAWMRSGFSEDFPSTIAGAADGSCSGLQHYAAIMRSEDEAHHVNLVPRDTVGDIYQIVAEAAVPSLKLAAGRGEIVSVDGVNIPQLILDNGFGRSEVKRNVMTYFYGSGKFGMRDQHMEDTMRPWADKVALGEASVHPYQVEVERENKTTGEKTRNLDGGYSCAQVMAAHTYQAVVTVAPMADEAASWIQHVAATLAHEGLSMIWRTPTGMPVVQRYSEYTSKVINMWLYDRKVMVPTGNDKTDAEGNVLSRLQLLIREAPTKRVEKKRMRSASSPNNVHSMDGSHLHRSVAMGWKAGIRHFAMIHDSFGTHLGNMALFSRIIREAFVSIYENYCPLAELDRQAREVLSPEGAEKLKPIPAKGKLDLNLVKSSLYAFA
jgi:DNA-directed RNA polymerase, mitochondrial